MPRYVLDTSAVLAVLRGEPESVQVTPILGADDCIIHLAYITLMELEYRLIRMHRSTREIDQVLNGVAAWAEDVHESSVTWRREAAAIKARYPMSMADAWIAALALSLDAILVHKDPEFDPVPQLRSKRLTRP